MIRKTLLVFTLTAATLGASCYIGRLVPRLLVFPALVSLLGIKHVLVRTNERV